MEQITVVIPNYNGIKYLPDCLDSLQEQGTDTPRFKILVVDNGSTDGSVEYLKSRLKDGEYIFLEENTGFCHAVNVGIRTSDTPFVILLNNDTKARAGFVKSLYHAICEDDKIFSVSSKMLMWDRPELVDDAGDRYCVLGWAYSRGKGKIAAKFDEKTDVFAACGGASIYRRSVFEEIGDFDELHFAYLEDVDIGYRAGIYGYRNCYEPAAEVLHYGSASTGSRYNEWKTRHAAANSVYLIGKNMPFVQLIINFPFLLLGFLVKFLFFIKKGMGIIYIKGIFSGLSRCFSNEGRKHKVVFRWKHMKHYLIIQWELYVNTFRILMKS